MTGHSRNTIKKAIRGEPWGYKERKQQSFPALGSYLPIITEWLKKDKEQPKKQTTHGATGLQSPAGRTGLHRRGIYGSPLCADGPSGTGP
jgi:hypothetical protein